MFARWDKMSKAFARIGKEITIAVKASGPNPDNNPSLRRVIQNARALNMPKDKVEAAIKRASGQGGQAFRADPLRRLRSHGVALPDRRGDRQSGPHRRQHRAAFNKYGGTWLPTAQ